MNRALKIKIAAGALLLLTMLTFIFPIITFSDISISLLDMVGTSSDIKELMDEFGTSSELISGEMNSYFIFGLILFVLPAIECILLFIMKGKVSFIIGLAGSLVNNVFGFIFYDKISTTISLVNKAISFLSMDMEIRIIGGTIAFWCILHILIIAVSLFGLMRGETTRSTGAAFKPMSQILPEEISPMAKGNAPVDYVTQRQSFPQKTGLQKQQSPKIPTSTGPCEQPFYGGLAGRSGIYTGKIRLLKEEESLLVGTDEETCDVLLEPVVNGECYCRIRYDMNMQEYQLKPLCTNSVFLQSGQPLGKERIYCLPRGTVIVMKDKKSIFQLV